MSKEQYSAFIQKVQTDKELQQKLASQDLDLLALAKSLGFDVTHDDFVTADREALENESSEIGMKELADVAGGISFKPSSFSFSLSKLPGLKLDGAASTSSTTYWGPCCKTSFDAGATVSNPNPTKFM